MTGGDVRLIGLPRTGTTVLTHLLEQQGVEVVAGHKHEPHPRTDPHHPVVHIAKHPLQWLPSISQWTKSPLSHWQPVHYHILHWHHVVPRLHAQADVTVWYHDLLKDVEGEVGRVLREVASGTFMEPVKLPTHHVSHENREIEQEFNPWKYLDPTSPDYYLKEYSEEILAYLGQELDKAYSRRIRRTLGLSVPLVGLCDAGVVAAQRDWEGLGELVGVLGTQGAVV